MRTVNDAIAAGLVRSQGLIHWFIDDLKPEEWLHRPSPASNCAAWTVGHLILTDRRALKELGVDDLPELPDGFEHRFARDETAPRSGDYGDASILGPLFDRHRQRLIDAVQAAPPDQLNQPLAVPHPRFKTVGELVAYFGLHTAMHAGQITVIRRQLGRPPVV